MMMMRPTPTRLQAATSSNGAGAGDSAASSSAAADATNPIGSGDDVVAGADDDTDNSNTLSTDVDAGQDGDGDGGAASFDMVEATLQELHDCVITMLKHKTMTATKYRATYMSSTGCYTRSIEEDYYSRVTDWDEGHVLFTECLNKVEKMVTPALLAALVANASFATKVPPVDAKRLEGLTRPRGFTKHPLLCTEARGTNRAYFPELATNVATAHIRHYQQPYAKFFRHAPYQMQQSRPDASPALVAQGRYERDLNTLQCVRNLVAEATPQTRQMPIRDRAKIINIFAKALDSDAPGAML